MSHWTDEKEAPFKAWYLDVLLAIREVEVVSKFFLESANIDFCHLSDGSAALSKDVFRSPEAAVKEGRNRFASMTKWLTDKRNESHKKCRINLKVAEERLGVSK